MLESLTLAGAIIWSGVTAHYLARALSRRWGNALAFYCSWLAGFCAGIVASCVVTFAVPIIPGLPDLHDSIRSSLIIGGIAAFVIPPLWLVVRRKDVLTSPHGWKISGRSRLTVAVIVGWLVVVVAYEILTKGALTNQYLFFQWLLVPPVAFVVLYRLAIWAGAFPNKST